MSGYESGGWLTWVSLYWRKGVFVISRENNWDGHNKLGEAYKYKLASPRIAQFPQFHEHRFRVRLFPEFGKLFA